MQARSNIRRTSETAGGALVNTKFWWRDKKFLHRRSNLRKMKENNKKMSFLTTHSCKFSTSDSLFFTSFAFLPSFQKFSTKSGDLVYPLQKIAIVYFPNPDGPGRMQPRDVFV